MSQLPRELRLSDGATLQYFVDPEPPADSGLLIYHHGTPGAGPIDPGLIDAARGAGLAIVELVRPGYGRSSRHEGRSVADVAPLVVALADHLGYERFVTVGWSGGGPHAVATAALLPERCAGALCMAGVAPYDAAGLDFTAGMGEDNVREFDASVAGPAALEAYLRPAAAPLVDATGDAIVAELATLLPTVDRDLLTGEAGEHLAAEMRWSLSTGIWGWFDDDIAFVNPWGCALDDIVRPISVLQGTDDLMVPFAHGEWLAGHLPTAQAHLLSGEGHLSLINHVEVRVRELRSWLDER